MLNPNEWKERIPSIITLGIKKPSKVWGLKIGEYTLIVWSGGTAASTPSDEYLDLNKYTHLETAIYYGDKVLDLNINIEIQWVQPYSKNRGLNEPVENIEKLIERLRLMQELEKVPPPVIEKPCWHCGRKNFITDLVCWYCQNSNPTRSHVES